MERWVGRTAVVTGASSGIGAAVARALADAGLRVVAAARRYHLLEELQQEVKGSGIIIPVKCDVGREEELERLIEVAKDYGGVDVLVNNAALMFNGSVSGCSGVVTSLDDVKECVNVNVVAVIHATRLAVADMMRRNAPGLIIMVNSVVGHKIPVGRMPDMSVYPATKYMMTALTETMRLEFSHTGIPIRIASLSPGAVDTQMLHDAVSNMPKDMRDQVATLKSEDVADAVQYLLAAPDHVNISELTVQVVGETAL